jgi:hypothetical protein
MKTPLKREISESHFTPGITCRVSDPKCSASKSSGVIVKDSPPPLAQKLPPTSGPNRFLFADQAMGAKSKMPNLLELQVEQLLSGAPRVSPMPSRCGSPDTSFAVEGRKMGFITPGKPVHVKEILCGTPSGWQQVPPRRVALSSSAHEPPSTAAAATKGILSVANSDRKRKWRDMHDSWRPSPVRTQQLKRRALAQPDDVAAAAAALVCAPGSARRAHVTPSAETARSCSPRMLQLFTAGGDVLGVLKEEVDRLRGLAEGKSPPSKRRLSLLVAAASALY